VQTAEFQLKHGMIDEVVHRRDLRQMLGTLLALYAMPRVDLPAQEEPATEPEHVGEPVLSAARA
jgi:acetyl-CoA carboxylase beta subunit